jgi:hypothetical protein
LMRAPRSRQGAPVYATPTLRSLRAVVVPLQPLIVVFFHTEMTNVSQLFALEGGGDGASTASGVGSFG